MRTAWARELIGGGVNEKGDKDSKEAEKKQQQRGVNDLVNDVSNSDDGVLKMAIGESDKAEINKQPDASISSEENTFCSSCGEKRK